MAHLDIIGLCSPACSLESLDPVVQSIVSLTSSFVIKMLTVLVVTISKLFDV